MPKPLILDCEECGQRNRIPAERLHQKAKCGRCKTQLTPFTEPYDVPNPWSFDAVLGADKPVLVDFYSDWCGPCQMMAPELEKLAAEIAEDTIVVKVNTRLIPELGQRYDIDAVPTLALFRGGAEKARERGAMRAPEIRRRFGV